MSKARELAELIGNAGGTSEQVLSGRRNLIINGGFDIWQRGTSFLSTTTNSHTADRWGVYQGNPNISKGTLDTTYGNVLEVTGTSNTTVYLTQRIENPELYQSKTITVSFMAKASSAVNINQKIRIGHASGVYDRNTIANFDLTTSWQKCEFTFDVDGESYSYNNSSYLEFQIISNSNINGITVSLAQVQLELGSVATPFEHRSYGEELALCQRYYEYGYSKLYVTNTTGITLSTSFVSAKRAAPSVSIVGGVYQPSGIEHSDLTSFKTYKAGTEQAFNWTADAEL